jgi:hypothetical protein
MYRAGAIVGAEGGEGFLGGVDVGHEVRLLVSSRVRDAGTAFQGWNQSPTTRRNSDIRTIMARFGSKGRSSKPQRL